jgi:hypothetical protein
MSEISGDDQRHPAQQPRRDLVGHRFPGPRRHHPEAVPPRHHRLDDFQLPRAERRIAEHFLQRCQRAAATVVGPSLLRALSCLAQKLQRLLREEQRRLAIAQPQHLQPRFDRPRRESGQRSRLGKYYVRCIAFRLRHFFEAHAASVSHQVA